jgi:hypothetical protein
MTSGLGISSEFILAVLGPYPRIPIYRATEHRQLLPPTMRFQHRVSLDVFSPIPSMHRTPAPTHQRPSTTQPAVSLAIRKKAPPIVYASERSSRAEHINQQSSKSDSPGTFPFLFLSFVFPTPELPPPAVSCCGIDLTY